MSIASDVEAAALIQLTEPSATKGAVKVNEQFSILPGLEIAERLTPFLDRAKEFVAMEKRAVIDSVDAMQRGTEFVSLATRDWKQVEAYRKSVKGPVDDYAKFIQSLFLPILNDIAEASKRMNAKMLAFDRAERKRREDEQAAQKAANEKMATDLAEAAQARGDTGAADAILNAALAAPPPRTAAKTTTSNSYGQNFSTRKTWTASVDNPMEVLKAIIDGKLPITLIKEWSQSELNRVAGTVKVTTDVNGLKIYQTETGGVR